MPPLEVDWRDPGVFFAAPPRTIVPAPITSTPTPCPPGQVYGQPPCPPGMACLQALRCYTPRNGGGRNGSFNGGNGGGIPDPFARLGDILAGFGRGGGITLPQPKQSASTVAFVPARRTTFNTAALVFIIIAVGAGGYWYYTTRKKGAA